MKQLAQNLRTGQTILLEVPAPLPTKGCLLIQTRKSLVSAGTENMLVEFSRASFLGKAKQRPDQLRLVLDKVKSDGLLSTVRTVWRRLDRLMPLGYCNAGIIIGIGEGVEGYQIGDRVISNGPHVEIVNVPVNLTARIPPAVTDEQAVFTVLGAVGLHGIRLLSPTLGETVVVIGLGLIGLLTADLLKLHGCQVIGIDPDVHRLKIAEEKGFLTVNPTFGNPEKLVAEMTAVVDGVIITASSKSSGIISQAAKMCRKRGRIVLIGSVGLHLNRADFYHKELTFQVSCSYGPGRYDPHYEEKGRDYPLPYVRWTENRNFQEVLRLLSTGALDPKPLISAIIPLQDFKFNHQNKDAAKTIGVLIDYATQVSADRVVQCITNKKTVGEPVAGIIGAGNFVNMTLLPAVRGKNIKYLASAGGMNATDLANKFEIPFITTDYQKVLTDPEVSIVLIATRHNDHAKMVVEALQAGKHVFVEKPLAITPAELDEIISVLQSVADSLSLTVGFNRRHSPYVRKMKELLQNVPLSMVITVNAGELPADSWLLDHLIGGGRLVGEACHFIDLASCIVGSRIIAVCASSVGVDKCMNTDVSILLRFENGSQATVHYFSNGHRNYPKERIEVHSAGRTLVLDDFKKLRGYGFKSFTTYETGSQKGHKEQWDALFEQVKDDRKPKIAFDEWVNTTRATFAALDSLKTGRWIDVL
ncbi:bi-domain-containing oxidoreductase [Dyadobacter sp. MSC1_007]|uniref:bi-domain-containing oxidoreductase n=1 Tax=Dyadobacter sp. MSC1_007 TaxID=2909264 RepID=UPI0020308E56|nr:bi-domain-containing oxidoreductase [Dyadobacter sp. MSC1_007]